MPPPPSKLSSSKKDFARSAKCLVQGLDDDDEEDDSDFDGLSLHRLQRKRLLKCNDVQQGKSSCSHKNIGKLKTGSKPVGRRKKSRVAAASSAFARTSNGASKATKRRKAGKSCQGKDRFHTASRLDDQDDGANNADNPDVEDFLDLEASCDEDDGSSEEGGEADVNSQGYDANDSFINDGSIRKRKRRRKRNDLNSPVGGGRLSMYSDTCSQLSEMSIDEEEEAMRLRAQHLMESPANRGLGLRHLRSNGVLGRLMGNLEQQQVRQREERKQARRGRKNGKETKRRNRGEDEEDMEVEVDMAVNSEEMELGDDYDEDDEEDVDPFSFD
eukprot:g2653.t1